MELQLGLAPPNQLMKGFDLNSPKEMGNEMSAHNRAKKRGFEAAFDAPSSGPIKTLPLLWGDQPHKDDDDDDSGGANIDLEEAYSFFYVNAKSIVGWPPIKATWKLGYGVGLAQRSNKRDQEGRRGYVKVNMEGVAIGRKVDLTMHESYHTLTHTLKSMFGIYHVSGEEGGGKGPSYKLTYQDKEGDWLSVGDVPWRTFIQTAQRLKLQNCKD